MRLSRVAALVVMLLASAGARAKDAEPQAFLPAPWSHTLPLSTGATALLATAAERSSIVAGLLKDLEQTDVVCYLTDSMPGVVAGPLSYLAFLSRTVGTRYLLIRIDQWRGTPSERIVSLGHELQHALEVAGAPEVGDAAGLARLYRRIGWEGEKDRFESARAKEVSSRVRRQLSQRNP